LKAVGQLNLSVPMNLALTDPRESSLAGPLESAVPGPKELALDGPMQMAVAGPMQLALDPSWPHGAGPVTLAAPRGTGPSWPHADKSSSRPMSLTYQLAVPDQYTAGLKAAGPPDATGPVAASWPPRS
jgi:hypothetical protein